VGDAHATGHQAGEGQASPMVAGRDRGLLAVVPPLPSSSQVDAGVGPKPLPASATWGMKVPAARRGSGARRSSGGSSGSGPRGSTSLGSVSTEGPGAEWAVAGPRAEAGTGLVHLERDMRDADAVVAAVLLRVEEELEEVEEVGTRVPAGGHVHPPMPKDAQGRGTSTSTSGGGATSPDPADSVAFMFLPELAEGGGRWGSPPPPRGTSGCSWREDAGLDRAWGVASAGGSHASMGSAWGASRGGLGLGGLGLGLGPSRAGTSSPFLDASVSTGRNSVAGSDTGLYGVAGPVNAYGVSVGPARVVGVASPTSSWREGPCGDGLPGSPRYGSTLFSSASTASITSPLSPGGGRARAHWTGAGTTLTSSSFTASGRLGGGGAFSSSSSSSASASASARVTSPSASSAFGDSLSLLLDLEAGELLSRSVTARCDAAAVEVAAAVSLKPPAFPRAPSGSGVRPSTSSSAGSSASSAPASLPGLVVEALAPGGRVPSAASASGACVAEESMGPVGQGVGEEGGARLSAAPTA
jgi:hypothetical protein